MRRSSERLFFEYHYISYHLMHRYNWIRPHQFNDALAPAQAEKNLTSCPGLVDYYTQSLKREELRVERIAIGQGVTLGLRFAIWPERPCWVCMVLRIMYIMLNQVLCQICSVSGTTQHRAC